MRSNHRRLPPVNRERRHDRADLKRIARAAMVEKGLEPDFSRDALSELDRIHGAAPPSGARDPRPARPALGLHRQRRFARPRPADGGRAARRRGGEDLRRGRRRGCPRRQGLRARRARADQHDVGLHGGRDLPDAPGEALDGHDVPERGRGPPRGRRRDDVRQGRRRSRPRTSTARPSATRPSSPTTACRWGSRAGEFPEKAQSVAGVPEQLKIQDGVAQALRSAATSRAPSISRRSSRAPSLPTTRSWTSPSRRRTARGS